MITKQTAIIAAAILVAVLSTPAGAQFAHAQTYDYQQQQNQQSPGPYGYRGYPNQYNNNPPPAGRVNCQ